MSTLSILIASLIGSPHCAAMCGGFVMATASNIKDMSFYHFGRGITYVLLGMIAGALGSALNLTSDLAGVNAVAPIVVGCLLISFGIYGMFGHRQIKIALFQPLIKLVYPIKNSTLRAFLIGTSSSCLPCGWLYSYVLVAAGSGNALEGGIIMLIFWIGTLPMLAMVGKFSQLILKKVGASLPIITQLLIIAAGVFSIFSHTVIHHSHHH